MSRRKASAPETPEPSSQIELERTLATLSARQLYERYAELRQDPAMARALKAEVMRRWGEVPPPEPLGPEAPLDQRALQAVLFQNSYNRARWSFWREAGATDEEMETELARALSHAETALLPGGAGFQVECRGGAHPQVTVSQGWMDEAPHRLSGRRLVQVARELLQIPPPEPLPLELCTLTRVLSPRALLERMEAAPLDSPERRAAREEIGRRVRREPEVYPEAPAAEAPLAERALWAVLHHHENARPLWAFWREAGATDEDLRAVIPAAAGGDPVHQRVGGGYWVEYRSGAVLFGRSGVKKPEGSLTGRALLLAVRSLWGIEPPAPPEREEEAPAAPPLLTEGSPARKKKSSGVRKKIPALGVQLSLGIA